MRKKGHPVNRVKRPRLHRSQAKQWLGEDISPRRGVDESNREDAPKLPNEGKLLWGPGLFIFFYIALLLKLLLRL